MSAAIRRAMFVLAVLASIPIIILGVEWYRLSRCAICGKVAADIVEEELHWGDSTYGLCDEHLEALNIAWSGPWHRGRLREWIREMQDGPELPADALQPTSSR